MRSVIKLAQSVLNVSRFTLIISLALVFSISAVYTYTRVTEQSSTVYAATSSTLNFQGRLLNANGSLVPDGLYNLEFKLYDGGTQGGPGGAGEANAGTLLWTETRDYNGGSPDQRVRVVNGYFTVNLGEVDAFSSTIDWDQELWITMNVGGSGTSPSWDGEMLAPGNKRTKLTAVPYAFQAGSARRLIDEQLSGTGTLEWLALTGNRTISLPDATGTVLLDSTGFANGGNSFGGTATLGTNDANDLILETAGNEGLRIDQDGDVSIGTGADGLEKLDINGALRLGTTSSTNAGTIRWTGTDFEGYDGSEWKSLTYDGTLAVNPVANVRKGATETQNSTVNPGATLQPDDELFFNVGANETWSFRFVLQVAGNATPDIKFSVTAPTGATCVVGVSEAENALSNAGVACGVSLGAVPQTTSTDMYEVFGTVVNGTTPGAVTLNWAQNTANAANVSVLAGSYLAADRIAGPGQTAQAFIQDGNSFGLDAVMGTNDTQALRFETDGVERANITSTGVFNILSGLNASGGIDILTGDLEINGVTVLNSSRALDNLTGLTVTSGGASITGGIDNNSGGLTEAGAISGATTIDASGLITGTSGLTITGATTSLNNNSNFATNINTGTSTGAITIGGGSADFALDSTAFDVTTAGALSGITTINASGAITAATATDTINGLVINAGSLSSITGFTQASGNFSFSNTSGTFAVDSSALDISAAGAISGATTINASGAITAATATDTINGLVINAGSLSSITGFTQASGNFSFNSGSGTFSLNSNALDISSSGAISGIESLTGSAALVITSGGSGALTLDSASNTLIIAASDTGLQRTASGSYTIDLNDSAATTLTLNNTGTGAASLNLQDGGLQVAGTSVLTNGRALENLTGLTVTSGGASITGGIDTNSGTISEVSTISGTAGVIDFDNFDVASSGAVTLTGNLTLSGDANEGISGGGLTDCDSTYSKLQWDSTTNKFLCGSDLPQMVYASDATNTTWADNNTTDLWNGTEPSITIQANSEVLVLANFRATGDPGSQNVELAARIDREGAGVASDCADVNTVGTTFAGSYTDNAGADPTALITGTTSFVDAPGAAGAYTYAFCTSADTVIGGGTWTENGLNLTLYQINDAADLAEVYPTKDTSLVAGEVVSLDPTGNVAVERSSKAYDPKAVGVVATKPGLVIGNTDGESPYGKPVALAGRVPVKVTTQNGAIKKGDFLTSSSIPGVAMKATKSGPIIGIAMGDYNGTDVGTVMVFVQNGNSNGQVDRSKDSKGLLEDLVAGRADLLANSEDLSTINTDVVSAGLELITPKVITNQLDTNEIVVNENGLQFKDNNGKTIGSIAEDGTLTASNVRILGEQGLDYGSELDNLKARVNALETSSQAVTNINNTSLNLQGLTVNLDLIARGSLVVDGQATFKEMAKFEKDAQFEGEVNVLGYTNLQGLTVNLDLIARGSLVVDGQATFKEMAKFEKDAQFEGNVEVKGEFKTNADTAGIAKIKEGETKVEIKFAKRKTMKPIITLSVANGKFIQYSYQNVSEDGFEIIISGPAPEDLEFSWYALQAATPPETQQP